VLLFNQKTINMILNEIKTIDIDGKDVIINPHELKRFQIKDKYTVCPACLDLPKSGNPFKNLSGWDGHALKCAGLASGSHQEKKDEFRRLFSFLLK
jgi:hypothetical protein